VRESLLNACGHVMSSAIIQPSPPFRSSQLRGACAPAYRDSLDPRPRLPLLSGESNDTRFSESDDAYRLLQPLLRRASTSTRATDPHCTRSILAFARRTYVFALASRVPSFEGMRHALATFSRRVAGSEPREIRRCSPHGAYKDAARLNPEGHRSSACRLRATYRSNRRLRRRLVDTMAKFRMGRETMSEGPPLSPYATPHDEVDKGSPPQNFSSTP